MATLLGTYGALGEFGTPTQRSFNEGASQTFVVGDWLTLDSSGNAIAAQATAGSEVVAGTKLLGLSLSNAHNMASAVNPITGLPYQIDVALADSETTFRMPAFSATLSSAITAGSQIGATYGLINKHDVTGGSFAVDLDDTATAPKMEVQGIDPTYSVGTTYGVLYVKVTQAQRILG